MQRTDTSKSAELLAKAKKDSKLFKEYKSEKAGSELLSATKQFMENFIEVLGLQSFSMLSTQVKNATEIDLSRLKKFDGILASADKDIILSKDEVKAVLDTLNINNGKLKKEFRDIMDVCRKAFDETKMSIGQKYLASSKFLRVSAQEARAALKETREAQKLERALAKELKAKAPKPSKSDDEGPTPKSDSKEPTNTYSRATLAYQDKIERYIELAETSLSNSLESLEKFVALMADKNGIGLKDLPSELSDAKKYGAKRANVTFSEEGLNVIKKKLKLDDEQNNALASIVSSFKQHYKNFQKTGFAK